MLVKKELINLTIQNNSDCTFNIPLFQSNVASINATTKYEYDITGVDLSCGYGDIYINNDINSFVFNGTLTGLLSALNNLGYGLFCSRTSGGNTYIFTCDDTNVYDLLDLCTAPSSTTTTTTTTTTSTTTSAPTTTTSTTTSTTTQLYNVTVNVASQAVLSPSANVKVLYSINGGATWTQIATLDPSVGYPNYNVIYAIAQPLGTSILIGITDSSDSSIQYGSGYFSGDFVSLCGLSNPYVIASLSGTTNIYLNVGVSGGALVPCNATTTTTSTTTSTTTAPPTTTTTTTTTTSTTTAPPTTTTTTTTSTTTVVGTSYDVSATSSVDAPTACAYAGSTQTLYAVESVATSVTKFYTNIGCTIAYSGDTNYYKFQKTGGGGSYSCTIALSGSVANIAGCL